jgi:hypothetical protein
MLLSPTPKSSEQKKIQCLHVKHKCLQKVKVEEKQVKQIGKNKEIGSKLKC